MANRRVTRSSAPDPSIIEPDYDDDIQTDANRIIKGLFNQRFVDAMYDNMWRHFNVDMLNVIMQDLRFRTRCGSIRGMDSPQVQNVLLFKELFGRATGHYSYIDMNFEEWGTYEKGLIHTGDDGVCHGAALAAALIQNGVELGNILLESPHNTVDLLINYKVIMKAYLFIIDRGVWDRALNAVWNIPLTIRRSDGLMTCNDTVRARGLIMYFLQELENVFEILPELELKSYNNLRLRALEQINSGFSVHYISARLPRDKNTLIKWIVISILHERTKYF